MEKNFINYMCSIKYLMNALSAAKTRVKLKGEADKACSQVYQELPSMISILSKIQTDPLSVDVDDLVKDTKYILDLIRDVLKGLPANDKTAKLQKAVNDFYTQDDIRKVYRDYVEQFDKPFDINKVVNPKEPFKFSDDPLEKKMQMAAFRRSFMRRYDNFASNDHTDEQINKEYNAAAQKIKDGTDENLVLLKKMDPKTAELICDAVLSKGPISSKISLKPYDTSTMEIEVVGKNIKRYMDAFFAPVVSGDHMEMEQNDHREAVKIVEETTAQLVADKITVPEGLTEDEVSTLVMSEYLSDDIMAKYFTEGQSLSGSSVIDGEAPAPAGRMAFAQNVLKGDSRPNMQYMRRGIIEGRNRAKLVLEQYKLGNKKPMADIILKTLINNASYQKVGIKVEDNQGAFYSKAISDAIKLLDSDQFRGLVEIPQEVRDINKLGQLRKQALSDINVLQAQMYEYSLKNAKVGKKNRPFDDPQFMKMYASWFARSEHIKALDKTLLDINYIGATKYDSEFQGRNRELTSIEKKWLENPDAFMKKYEEAVLNRPSLKKMFNSEYGSWMSVLSGGIGEKPKSKFLVNRVELAEKESLFEYRKKINAIDDKKYPGLKDKLYSIPPMDGSSLSKDASTGEINFRLSQFEQYLEFVKENVPADAEFVPIPEETVSNIVIATEKLIENIKRSYDDLKPQLQDIRNLEENIGVFTDVSTELQEKYIPDFDKSGNAKQELTADLNKQISDLEKIKYPDESINKLISDLRAVGDISLKRSQLKNLETIYNTIDKKIDEISSPDYKANMNTNKLISQLTGIMTTIDRVEDAAMEFKQTSVKQQDPSELITRLGNIAKSSLVMLRHLDFYQDLKEVKEEIATIALCNKQILELSSGEEPQISNPDKVIQYAEKLVKSGAMDSVIMRQDVMDAVMKFNDKDAVPELLIMKIGNAVTEGLKKPAADLDKNKSINMNGMVKG